MMKVFFCYHISDDMYCSFGHIGISDILQSVIYCSSHVSDFLIYFFWFGILRYCKSDIFLLWYNGTANVLEFLMYWKCQNLSKFQHIDISKVLNFWHIRIIQRAMYCKFLPIVFADALEFQVPKQASSSTLLCYWNFCPFSPYYL